MSTSAFSRTWSVAMRDFRHTVLTKAFILGVVGVPLLLLGVGAIAGVMIATHEEPPLVGIVVVVGADDAPAEALRLEFAALGEGGTTEAVAIPTDPTDALRAMGSAPSLMRGEISLEVESLTGSTDALSEDVRSRVASGELLAAAIIGEATLAVDDDSRAAPIDLVVAEGVDSDHIGTIERALGRAVIRVRAIRAGLDPARAVAMMAPPRTETRRLTHDGSTRSESRGLREIRTQVVPMVFLMLLFGATIGTSNHLLMSTIEEKSNKVMEVLLSAVSPLQLMAGKIIGQGLVGLVIVGVYGGLGIAGLIAFRAMDLVTTTQLVLLAIFYPMAYFMVASLMAAVGSAVSDIREANSLVTPVMMCLMVPWILWMPISQSPNGVVAEVFSFIPPAIPFVMIVRVAAEEPVPVWQVVASIGWGAFCAAGMVWGAARIFRVGVLMTGKPPSLLELLRWVRYS